MNISRENIKLKEGYYSLSQNLTKKTMDLDEKEKMIAKLRFTTDRIYF
jgi:DNA-directed RNA polymerase specialized sigma subunit